MRARHQDARERDDAHELDRIERRAARERRALDLHEVVDRHALGMRIERRERVQEGDAVRRGLAHAEDAAAADVDAGVADRGQRVEAVLVGARRDDLAVERFGRVEVVVVVVEAGGLRGAAACGGVSMPSVAQVSRPSSRTPRTIADDLVEVAVLRAPPGRAHAEARGAGSRARRARVRSRRRDPSAPRARGRCRSGCSAGSTRNPRDRRRS